MEHKITTNHEEIMDWMTERGGVPAIDTRNTNRRVVEIRFDDTKPSLEPISWDEFFDIFETSNFALRYDVDGEEQGEFSYGFIDRDHMPSEVDIENEMPEDVPIENVVPSAPADGPDSLNDAMVYT